MRFDKASAEYLPSLQENANWPLCLKLLTSGEQNSESKILSDWDLHGKATKLQLYKNVKK